MSAGNLLGSIFNTVLFGCVWTGLGGVVDKLFKAFNSSATVLPTLQDAMNGMTIMQTIWSIILILMFIVIWMNYLLNENSRASGGV